MADSTFSTLFSFAEFCIVALEIMQSGMVIRKGLNVENAKYSKA